MINKRNDIKAIKDRAALELKYQDLFNVLPDSTNTISQKR